MSAGGRVGQIHGISVRYSGGPAVALAPGITRTISGVPPPLIPRVFALLRSATIFLILVLFPIGVSAGRYWFAESRGNWQTADRSSAGLLPLPSQHAEAIIRVYGARTVRWKAIFAIHTWIVVKEHNAATYTRYDYTAWGAPIRTNGFAADARWFGAVPETIAALDGAEAAFRRAIEMDPRLDRAWYGLGLVLIRQRRFDEAAQALERNTKLQPMSPYGWYQLARVNMDRHRPEEARRIVRHLKNFEPKVAAQLEREIGG